MDFNCSLSEQGMRSQRDRYDRLATSVVRVDRTQDRVTVEFTPGFDRNLLEEALAIERECCPFFRFEVGDRTLAISVDDAGHAPALEALAYALSARPPAPSPA